MYFLCIYLGEGRGCTNACICMGTHSQRLLQNCVMDVYKTWQGWRSHGPANALRCCGQIRPGADPGGAKIGHGGPLLQEISSSDQEATETNQMDSNDLEACGKKCCYFWFHSKVKFLTRFWRLFGLSHFYVFLCNFNRFLCIKELYLQLFCVIYFHIFMRENADIKDLNAWRILMNFLCKLI